MVFRALVIAACVFSIWRSVQFARTDWLAGKDTRQALTEAVGRSPDDPLLMARLALARANAGDPDAEVNEELRRAARLDPFNAEVLMTLGLHEEFDGDRDAATRELMKAAEIDHQFKPAWTLASFYVRNGEPAKAWPMLERILKLDPLGFDLAPVFDLCWRIGGEDPARIFSLIPRNGSKPEQYLAFLMNTNRTNEALQVWPVAFQSALHSDTAGDTELVKTFPDFLLRANRVAEAVHAWNQLVESGLIHSGLLDPAKGESIADPDFRFPAGAGFAWRLDDVPNVNASIYDGALHLELSIDEPEAFRVMAVIVPLQQGRQYRLSWKTDASGAGNPKDTGFRFRRAAGGVTNDCPPLLTSTACDFASAPGSGTTAAVLSLEYTRALGTTRLSGTLAVSSVRLEMMP